jgi:hypothetical protein
MDKEKIIKVLYAAFKASVCEDFGFNEQFELSTNEVKEALNEFDIEADCFDKYVSVKYYAKEYKEKYGDKIPTIDEIKEWFKEENWYNLNDKEAKHLIETINRNN